MLTRPAFDTSVKVFVHSQIAAGSKSLSTIWDFTSKRSDSGVDPQMTGQVSFNGVPLVTEGTCEWSLIVMSPDMGREPSLVCQLLVTNLTCECFDPSVGLQMTIQVLSECKLLTTCVTSEMLFFRMND
jgi:hypothetical protein